MVWEKIRMQKNTSTRLDADSVFLLLRAYIRALIFFSLFSVYKIQNKILGETNAREREPPYPVIPELSLSVFPTKPSASSSKYDLG